MKVAVDGSSNDNRGSEIKAEMPIEFNCPHCQRPYKVADANAGKRFACKQCGNAVQVPGGQPAPAPAPAARPMARAPGAAPRPAGPSPQPGAPAPYGVQPQDDGPKTRAPNYVFLGGAAAMTIGFFLPWISIEPLFNFGGYELPGKFMDFVRVIEQFVEPGTPEYEQVQDIKARGTFLYSMYLIPILCLAAGIEELIAFKKGRNFWWLRAIAAASPVIAFITVMIAFSGLSDAGSSPSSGSSPSGGPSVFDILGFGVYICFAGFVAAAVGVFTNPKAKSQGSNQPPRRPRPPGGPRPAGAGPAPAPRPGAGPRPAPGNRPGPARPQAPGGPRLPGPKLPRPRQ